ncbi:MAG: Flp pilus assembly protein CpaB [Chloroflexi bacterium]|nr:MAG: Flp pilus assembly protein CpaB [Chloroflexota bacterium]
MARMQGLALPSGNRGLLIIAALAGLAAAVLFVVAVNNNGSSTRTTSSVTGSGNAVVAVKDITAGNKIEATMVEIKSVPNDLFVAGAINDITKVVGQYAANDIRVGEQITGTRVGSLPPPNCGLACVVSRGSYGSGLQVKEVTAVGGLLYAGNRVDVIGSFKMANDGSVPGCQERFILRTQTILQNVEVLSVAQQTLKPPAANNTAAADANSNTSGQTSDLTQQPGAATITLSLGLEDSERLYGAQGTARTVWTSVRPAGDNEIRDVPPVNACLPE